MIASSIQSPCSLEAEDPDVSPERFFDPEKLRYGAGYLSASWRIRIRKFNGAGKAIPFPERNFSVPRM